ncbi:class I SAM-dependent methyltransferase [Chryseobacterium sp. H1D6B]|uniref:class I SAM-dependent methyltransferase n=1 Tax=Chryseobacterium sp. H1D6B TaxID=2940588 RepID=UPI0015CAE5C1|nr:class I SAM-dependent methyltransferase [Chryseobacterium sp. H1D6B]
MRIITIEDLKDIYIKFHQRGLPFLLSKFNLDSYKRTQSAFNEKEIQSSNFWLIPDVKKRWNTLITGNEATSYEEYITEEYFKDRENLKILALGSGVCSHEIRLAELNPHWEIHCFDFSDELLKKAKTISDEKNLKNIFYAAENILKYPFKPEEYDIVFFHASLHHFDHIHQFMDDIVIKSLKPDGYIIINEFVGNNRLQYSKIQLDYINRSLKEIPKKYRKIFKTNMYKNKYYGSGSLRMIIADPSECADSINILPAIHEKFDTIEEKPFGNNILQSALKDIAHHFIDSDPEKKAVIKKVFALEDELLKVQPSDFVFGIYKLKPSVK